MCQRQRTTAGLNTTLSGIGRRKPVTTFPLFYYLWIFSSLTHSNSGQDQTHTSLRELVRESTEESRDFLSGALV